MSSEITKAYTLIDFLRRQSDKEIILYFFVIDEDPTTFKVIDIEPCKVGFDESKWQLYFYYQTSTKKWSTKPQKTFKRNAHYFFSEAQAQTKLTERLEKIKKQYIALHAFTARNLEEIESLLT